MYNFKFKEKHFLYFIWYILVSAAVCIFLCSVVYIIVFPLFGYSFVEGINYFGSADEALDAFFKRQHELRIDILKDVLSAVEGDKLRMFENVLRNNTITQNMTDSEFLFEHDALNLKRDDVHSSWKDLLMSLFLWVIFSGLSVIFGSPLWGVPDVNTLLLLLENISFDYEAINLIYNELVEKGVITD